MATDLRTADADLNRLTALLDELGRSSAAATERLQTATSCREEVEGALGERVGRLVKRLNETDPVTGQARYGEATAAKVRAVVARFGDLKEAVYPLEERLRDEVQGIDAITSAERVARAAAAAAKKLEEAREEEQRLEDKRRKAAAEAAAARREKEELAAAAEAHRMERARLAKEAEEMEEAERLRLEREAEQLEAAAAVGVAGVEDGLRRLDRELGGDAARKAIVVGELSKLLKNIVTNPDEPKFKTIRVANEAFYRAMGRFEGAVHILISAGFRLRVVGGQKLLVMTEPQPMEMDAWAAWYQNVKDAVQRLKEETENPP